MSKLKPCPKCYNDVYISGRKILCTNCNLSYVGVQGEDALIKDWNHQHHGWRPIETAPKDGTTIVLINIETEEAIIGRWHNADDELGLEEAWCCNEWEERTIEPTHWQPKIVKR